MTNLEALKGKVNYPLDDNSFILALTDRELIHSETYSTENKRSLELAHADCLVTLISSPNISEDGYSITLSDKASLQKIASGIYKKWGVSDPSTPTASFISPCTLR